MTVQPPESTRSLAAPTLAETNAISNAGSDEEIRLLAQQLVKSGQLGFDPTTVLKGVVTAIDVAGQPPTLSIQISGDTTTTITGVRLLDNYSPSIGHTVLVDKLGSDIVVRGHIADSDAVGSGDGAGGWIKATLAAGSHGGNNNGDVSYRRILDHGSWKMQWRGGWNVSGTDLIDSGDALGVEYRPSSLRSLLATRTAIGGSNNVKLDFNTDGTVELVGATTSPNSASISGDVFSATPSSANAGGTDVRLSGYLSQAGSDLGHSHALGSHGHGSHDHGFSGGSHSHGVSSPTWVSLHNVEYFL